jgi:hypothetical protein
MIINKSIWIAVLTAVALLTKCQTSTLSEQIEIPWFEVEVKLSEKAQQVLHERGETIIISVEFSGIPRPDSPYKPSPMGNIGLGVAQIELPEEGIAKFENLTVPKKKVDALVDPDYEVLVNVASGRRSDKNNLLWCSIVQDKISMVQKKRHLVKGKLISEVIPIKHF